jgi:hypothetical protein
MVQSLDSVGAQQRLIFIILYTVPAFITARLYLLYHYFDRKKPATEVAGFIQ